jgi:hypothetical protein
MMMNKENRLNNDKESNHKMMMNKEHQLNNDKESTLLNWQRDA